MQPNDHDHVQRILERANERVARQEQMRAQMASADAFSVASAGTDVLVAEGDSWFDFPGTDVIEELEDTFGYEVESVAHRGDTLESIAYDEKQLDGFERRLARLARRDKKPKAVLLSGGGNDIAGDEFAIMLNHQRSGLPTINDDVARGVIDVRLRAAYLSLISKIGALTEHHFGQRDIPVIVHGYDRPVPDGRGFWSGFSVLPGPWLKPGFDAKGYLDNLQANTDVMGTLIDRTNDMLATLSGEPGFAHVHHVDLRGTLSNVLENRQYRDTWADELHPSDEDGGFMAVAGKLHARIQTL